MSDSFVLTANQRAADAAVDCANEEEQDEPSPVFFLSDIDIAGAPWLLPPSDVLVTTSSPEELAGALASHGLLVAPGLIPVESANAARREVERSICEHHGAASESRRRTLALDATAPTIVPILRGIANSPLGVSIASTLGEDAALCDLVANVSAPGAPASSQAPGFETPALAKGSADDAAEEADFHQALASRGQGLLSVHVALGNVEKASGPMLVWAATHGRAFHQALEVRGADALQGATGIWLDLACGDGALADSRLVRYHSSNNAPPTSATGRQVTLVATFTSAALLPAAMMTASRRESSAALEQVGRLSLRNMDAALRQLASTSAKQAAASSSSPSSSGRTEGAASVAARSGTAEEAWCRAELEARWQEAHAPSMLSAPAADRYMRPRAELVRTFEAAMQAAAQGDVAGATRWLDTPQAGASVDARGGDSLLTLLMQASAAGHEELARALLFTRGADPNVTDAVGRTALHAAACHGHATVVQLLLKAGANVDGADGEGMCAAAWAAARGHEEVRGLLAGQHFAPRLLRGLLSDAEIRSLLSLWGEEVTPVPLPVHDNGAGHRVTPVPLPVPVPVPVHDNGAGHSTIYLHAGQREGRGALHADDERSRILARVVDLMRRHDPRATLHAPGDLARDLNVRCCELHRYVVGGGLLDRNHRDSGSMLTMSVTLSDPAAVEGGHFVTWPGAHGQDEWTDDDTPTLHPIGRGDAILFRSEDLHNVLPVTDGGPRYSLVVELWAGPVNNEHRHA